MLFHGRLFLFLAVCHLYFRPWFFSFNSLFIILLRISFFFFTNSVRGKSTKSSVSKSMARQGGHRRNIRNPVHKWNVGSMFTKDNFHEKRENFHKGKKRNEGGKVTKTCNPRSKNLAYFSNIDFQKGLGSDDCSLLEEGYTSAGRDSGFSSLCPTSGSQKHVSFLS